MVDVGAVILQAAQAINQATTQRRQLQLQEEQFQFQKAKYAETQQLQERKLEFEQKAFEAEQQYKEIIGRQKMADTALTVARASETQRQALAANRFGDPNFQDEASKASARKFSAYSTVPQILKEIDTLTRTTTQFAPTSTEYKKLMSRVQELQQEVGYRSSWLADNMAAAMFSPQSEDTQAAADGMKSAVDDLSKVAPDMPVPNETIVSPGSSAPATPEESSPTKKLLSRFPELLKEKGKRPNEELLLEAQKAARELRRIDPTMYNRVLKNIQKTYNELQR